MIVLDTHIWYWWVSQSSRWKPDYQEWIDEHADGGLGLSVISCWEVAKKNQSLAVQVGDLIVCRTNGSLDLVGKAAVIPKLDSSHAFASYLIRLRLDHSYVLPDYFHAFLLGPRGRD